MLKLLHLGLIANLILAFAQAPLQHIHDGHSEQDHAAGFSHAHALESHPDSEEDGIEIEDSDHDSDARLLDWFAGDGSSPVKFIPDLPATVLQPLLVVQSSLILEFTPRSHDPPWRLSLHPRAPPA